MTKPTGQPRGRKGWAQGNMLEFLMSRRAEYDAARDADAAGPFYSKMARLWTVRYDWKLPSEVNPLAEVPSPDDSVLHDDAGQDLDEAELKRREEILKELKHKIGAWYRHHCRKVVSTDSGTNETWATGLLHAAVEPPKRAQPCQFYSRKYYATRVRPTVVTEWAAKVQKNAQDGKPPLTKDDLFAFRMSVTRRLFQFESRDFKKQLQEEIEEEHSHAMDDYHERYVRDPVTPKQYHLALNSCYMALQPIVDLISRRYGMVAALTFAGPVPSKNGAIEAFTVHSGKTYGVHEKSWPEFDNNAHREFCKAFVTFAESCFTSATCRARAYTNVSPEPEVQPGSEMEDAGDASEELNPGAQQTTAPTPSEGSLATGGRDTQQPSLDHDEESQQPSLDHHGESQQPSLDHHGESQQPSLDHDEESQQPSLDHHSESQQPSLDLRG
ncbi:hypothetical protein BV25DRAFT_1843459, partial [Artomyces pyxidatus]